MHPYLRQALTFVTVAALCTVLDVSTVAFTHLVLDLPLLAAVALGFSINVGTGFALSRLHVFPEGRTRLRTASWRYAVLVALNVLVGVGGVTALVDHGVSYLAARVGASGLLVVVNYVAMRWWVFDVRRVA